MLMVILPVHASSTGSPSTATSSGIMIPLYTYPGSTWTAVINAKAANPSVPVVAIINPNSGPGASFDANYANGIKQLQAAGVVVLGYDHTSYGARSLADVEADASAYSSWYHVNGLFFDEMANAPGYEAYYSTLTSFAKSLGEPFTVGNPGSIVPSSYLGTVSSLVVYENQGLPSSSLVSGLYGGYAKGNFTVMSYGVPQPSVSQVQAISNYAGYLFFTDDGLPNPYGALPSYFGSDVSVLSSLSSQQTATSSTSSASTTVTSTSTATVTTTTTETITATSTSTAINTATSTTTSTSTATLVTTTTETSTAIATNTTTTTATDAATVTTTTTETVTATSTTTVDPATQASATSTTSTTTASQGNAVSPVTQQALISEQTTSSATMAAATSSTSPSNPSATSSASIESTPSVPTTQLAGSPDRQVNSELSSLWSFVQSQVVAVIGLVGAAIVFVAHKVGLLFARA